MIILGIDPGTTRIGYGVINTRRKPKLVDYGLFTPKSKTKPGRLEELAKKLRIVISKWHPDAISLEELFFFKNFKTALSVAEARGVILLTAAEADLKVYEYTPLEIKQRVTGFGRADKKQVKKMVEILTGVKLPALEDDVTDAIAAALSAELEKLPEKTTK
jgi:crossover junction endodeoxyribonuclease RuvC